MDLTVCVFVAGVVLVIGGMLIGWYFRREPDDSALRQAEDAFWKESGKRGLAGPGVVSIEQAVKLKGLRAEHKAVLREREALAKARRRRRRLYQVGRALCGLGCMLLLGAIALQPGIRDALVQRI
jgi:hypothetical protein